VSTSIRPPGSAPGPAGLDGVDAHALDTPESTSKANAGVTETSVAARSSQAGPVSATAQAGQAQAAATQETPSARWIRRLEAGEVTRAEAIEGLVAQAVERKGGARLSPQLRSELEAVLRTALLEDPVLGRLLGDA
jgi:hypothetical protein